jgi:GT2 family glycosyltransferase
MQLRDVSVVVVTYESRDVIAACLESLDVPSPNAIVVVDIASSDGTAALVRESVPTARVVALDENVGFGAAANIGVDSVDTPYVAVLNPDARPVGDSLATLVACAARHADAAIVSPRLVDGDGQAQPSRIGYPTPLWTGNPAVSSFAARKRGATAGGFAVGAALLLRRDAFRAVGGFDPGFFLFYEEVDLCLRLEHAGWSIVSCPESTFVHFGGASTRLDWTTSYRHQLGGHLRFLSKHRGPAAAERSRRLLVVTVGARALSARRREVRHAASSAYAWLRSGTASELVRRG